MTTIAAHAEETARRAGEPYAGHNAKDTWDNWTIEAIQETLLRHRWSSFDISGYSFPTVASTSTYVLPQGISELQGIFEHSVASLPLTFTTEDELKRQGVDLTETGTPTHWYMSTYVAASNGFEIEMWPIPSAIKTYQVKAYRDGSDLVSTDRIPYPVALEPCTRHHVMSSFRDAVGDEQGFLRSRSMYNAALRSAWSRYRQSAARRHKFSWSDLGNSYTERLPTTVVP